MKTLIAASLKFLLTVFLMLSFAPDVNGQILKRLGNAAERAAERTVERRVEKETSEKTDQALDSIFESGQKDKSPNSKTDNPLPSGNETNDPISDSQPEINSGNTDTPNGKSVPQSIAVYSKFDFVPGDKVVFFDDFANDFIGDFPSKWNTNATGEVVSVEGSPQKWFELKGGYNLSYIPDVPTLPEEYTIEFDILALGLDSQTSSGAYLVAILSDDALFGDGKNFVHASIPFCQYAAVGITAVNRINGKGEIRSTLAADIRDEVNAQPHIAIAINKQRYRLWVNEEKYIDIPRMVPEGAVIKALKFNLSGVKVGKERIFITNLKVSEGGLDLRRTLISEGRVSTNGILFDSGSANIQRQSMGIILQISQVLQQEGGMKLKIIGHTDSDGEDAKNTELSKKRAEAVKNALVSVYKVSADRLTTEGKGETEPVGDNATPDGKAQNRRVEFIKL
ncbi:MAG TPA: OmpA family protein [Pricia sp.]|nr:OmpA family protein [Pricia sp.]